ncbi:hypothetical protein E3N88_03218 [Mikania micrantha]|uniref:RRM domain-containing protein n=1 Tax=Mikania micrantha TaxID=192012 RepID=A0A5N6Q642_9ASTR|nr:hypothetical protein E3N88_03218 [Mikania micrantha]
MAECLDMSLDDIIRNNKKSGRSYPNISFRAGGSTRGGSRGHGHSSGRHLEPGPGPARRSDNRLTTMRMKPYFVPQAFPPQNMLPGGEFISEAETKLYISNLDYDVSNEDIRVLFSDVGELKHYSIHYDRSGRSKGTAEVVYMLRSDAMAAMKRYNNVLLDGKPLKLELVGINIISPVPVPPMQRGILGSDSINSSRGIQGRIVGRGQDRGGNNTYHQESGRGHGGDGNCPEKISANDLDADLERRIVWNCDLNVGMLVFKSILEIELFSAYELSRVIDIEGCF